MSACRPNAPAPGSPPRRSPPWRDLPLGDLQYEDATLSKFQQVYDPTWGRLKAISRPAVGNHEYYLAGASGYFDYFGEAAGPREQGYYSYDIGTWHVVALNSNCTIVACAAGSAQEQWLRADLAASSADCTLAYFHHPYLGAQTSTNQLGSLWRALYDNRADVVLAGHEHNYQRFAPQDASGTVDRVNGIREFVVGTGGKNLTSSADAANRELLYRAGFGVLLLTLGDGSYDWRFAGTQGQPVDDGSSTCSPSTAAPASPQPTATPPSPEPTATPPSPSSAPCPSVAPSVELEPAVISAGQQATVRVRAEPERAVELWAYTRPSTAYSRVRTGTTDASGTATFSVRPSANTRLYAAVADCPGGGSVVLAVRTALSLAVSRTGTREYVFSGDSLPARRGGLIVSLYRVEAGGRQVLTAQARASELTGEWSLVRRFSGTGRFGFVVRTGQDLQNAPGTSAVRSVLVY
ncbi:MAG: metallophosphoesterase [Actinobacteria bacterium]|nr:metallophosphoesterase [Actinomycetota bacterium]